MWCLHPSKYTRKILLDKNISATYEIHLWILNLNKASFVRCNAPYSRISIINYGYDEIFTLIQINIMQIRSVSVFFFSLFLLFLFFEWKSSTETMYIIHFFHSPIRLLTISIKRRYYNVQSLWIVISQRQNYIHSDAFMTGWGWWIFDMSKTGVVYEYFNFWNSITMWRLMMTILCIPRIMSLYQIVENKKYK